MDPKELSKGRKKRNQSTMMTDSIVSQIPEDIHNKLGLVGDQNGELAMFGGNMTELATVPWMMHAPLERRLLCTRQPIRHFREYEIIRL